MPKINIGYVGRFLLIFNMLMAMVYMAWWFDFSHADNMVLYSLLLAGEIYHVFMAITFWHTIMPPRKAVQPPELKNVQKNTVAVFIPVVSEPVDIVGKTVRAAMMMRYPHKKVYILNDGMVAGNPDWEQYERLAEQMGCACITREVPGGAKAGNINHALGKTESDLVVIFDADMVPKKNFLEMTLPYFADPRTGFVQTPQYYNNHLENQVALGAWQQQEFFFGPIMKGKERVNASFICGTNVMIRREALVGVGGMSEESIAEDFLTSLYIHQKGWKSYYVPDVLAEGLAPLDALSYYKQQLRWARGSLEIAFLHNPLLVRGLSWGQRIAYLSSSLFYLNGLIVLVDIVMPLLYFFFGLRPVSAATTAFAFYFLPFMFMSLYTLYLASRGTLTFRAMSFSQSSWTIHLMALWSVLTGKKIAFQVTSKQAQGGNYLHLIYPHLLYILLLFLGAGWALYRDGISPVWVTNLAWAILNSLLFIPFMQAVIEGLRPVSKMQADKVVAA